MGFSGELSFDSKAFLDAEKAIPALSASHRNRLLARADASLTRAVPVRVSAPAPLGLRLTPTVVFASIGFFALGASAAFQVASSRLAKSDARTATGVILRRPASIAPEERMAPVGSEHAAPTAHSSARPVAMGMTRARVRQPRAETATAELLLVEDARQALAQQRYTRALSSLSDHARRFKGGRMTEECEALRVAALVGAGRGEEARRVAAAFSARFPHSPLRPAVETTSGSAP